MSDAVPVPARGDPGATEVAREAITMALYISLSLLAVMVALAPQDLVESDTPVLLVGVTSIGLILAHVVAFRVSSRFVHHGLLTAESARLISAQLAGGLAVTLVACVPLLVLDGSTAVLVAEIALLSVISGVAYASSRRAGASRLRAVGYLTGVVAAAGIVLVVKNLIPH